MRAKYPCKSLSHSVGQLLSQRRTVSSSSGLIGCSWLLPTQPPCPCDERGAPVRAVHTCGEYMLYRGTSLARSRNPVGVTRLSDETVHHLRSSVQELFAPIATLHYIFHINAALYLTRALYLSCKCRFESLYYLWYTHKGTSLMRNSAPLGPCSEIMPRALWWSYGVGCFL